MDLRLSAASRSTLREINFMPFTEQILRIAASAWRSSVSLSVRLYLKNRILTHPSVGEVARILSVLEHTHWRERRIKFLPPDARSTENVSRLAALKVQSRPDNGPLLKHIVLISGCARALRVVNRKGSVSDVAVKHMTIEDAHLPIVRRQHLP